ncbi:Hypothetical protein ABZS17G119_01188 [Kosakonia cowanii]
MSYRIPELDTQLFGNAKDNLYHLRGQPSILYEIALSVINAIDAGE